ncbi:DUF4038 domain-containing protein [Streptomyces shenzhenensis]|uniref:apiosidase-like domain-containing protein n=1 Tax=Streptomyces shenzhenensis TaxID=943815 RepID=UPI0034086C0A
MTSAAPWRPVELTLTSSTEQPDPYLGVDVWVDFEHSDGTVVRRPAFWDGGTTWRVRFTSPGLLGTWTWESGASVADPGLRGLRGTITVEDVPATGRFERHGFWTMSPDGRHLVHADGTPAVLAGDTAWGLPWRATPEQVRTYAQDRSAKGFNAVLLMSLMPDMGARGPQDRTKDEGFGVAFTDLPEGHLRALRPDYFQYLDDLVGIIVEHGLVPVWQPVFQGFGWKGLEIAGTVVPSDEYARYCRYLIARYGAWPAVWLPGADGAGDEPQIEAAGLEFEKSDAYGHPTGIHYRPHGHNRAHQDAPWLDFQWCQTGHLGDHIPERVADMVRNLPEKAVANGEPSYENTRETGLAGGWWQGHEAWSNLCAGAAMGAVYGAASLWQWKLHPDEPGHAAYFAAPGAGWREALDFEGSRYVGLVNTILHGLPFLGARPSWEQTMNPRGLLVPGIFYLAYAHNGGDLDFFFGETIPRPYRIVDPRSGEVIARGVRAGVNDSVADPGGAPRLFIFCDDFSGTAID